MSDTVEHGPGIALVHLNKPSDIALVAQAALATGSKLLLVGEAMSPEHVKVANKLRSWKIDGRLLDSLRTSRHSDLKNLKDSHTGRLIATVVTGGQNAFNFDWRPDDIIVIGGANGLSKEDMALTDEQVTIPTPKGMSFLTAGVVVSALVFHIVNRRH